MKKYCVHVYMRPYMYEDVEAKSPQEAESKVIKREFAGDYDEIYQIEVMLTCQNCHTDNEPANKKCDECGKKI